MAGEFVTTRSEPRPFLLLAVATGILTKELLSAPVSNAGARFLEPRGLGLVEHTHEEFFVIRVGR